MGIMHKNDDESDGRLLNSSRSEEMTTDTPTRYTKREIDECLSAHKITGSQLHLYSIAKQLLSDLDKARAILSFYEDESHYYKSHDDTKSFIEGDCGFRARMTLEEIS